jgi:hypothetical protein
MGLGAWILRMVIVSTSELDSRTELIVGL